MSDKTLVSNRKAFHDYHIMDRMEAGIALQGTEVKSLRAARGNLKDSWVDIDNHNEAFLMEMHISPYNFGNRANHQEKRRRKLLLKKREIVRLRKMVQERGLTIVPLRVYFKGAHIKVEIALAKGKKLYDKRETARRRQADLDIKRALKDK